MITELSKSKEIKIPGPDHPIAISEIEGTVRVTVAGRIVAESTRALRLEERDIRPSTICRATMSTCRCLFEPHTTPTVRTKAIARTTAFPSEDRNRNMPFGPTKTLMRQSPALRTTWRFIPHASMPSK